MPTCSATGLVRRVGAVAAVALLAACGAADLDGAEPGAGTAERPVTGAEAERLAVVRYQNFTRGVVPARVALRIDDQDLVLDADVDMRRGRGYGTFVATARPGSGAQSSDVQGSAGLIQWTAGAVALLPNGSGVAERPPPKAGWQVRPLAPESSRLDTALATVLALASDRPENPLLLQQGGAAYLSRQQLRGREVDVFRGPEVAAGNGTTNASRLTYLIDDSGALQRVNVALPGEEGPLTIDLLDGTGRRVSLIKAFEPG